MCSSILRANEAAPRRLSTKLSTDGRGDREQVAANPNRRRGAGSHPGNWGRRNLEEARGDGRHANLSTIYNLFESKEDVLTRVLNDAFGQYLSDVAERASSDPLQRFFDAVDVAAEFYSADAPFYRSSVWLVDVDSSYKLSLQRPRFDFFRDLVSQAIADGLLRPGTGPYVLSLMVVPMFSAP